MTEQPNDDLLVISRDLTESVKELRLKLTITDDATRRQQRWIVATWALTALVLAGLIFTWSLYQQIQDAVDVNEANAVTSCQNANESRVGARRLWLGIIDAPGPDGKPVERPPAVQAQVNDLRSFVEELYQQRDCSDLGREYPLPELPDSLKPKE